MSNRSGSNGHGRRGWSESEMEQMEPLIGPSEEDGPGTTRRDLVRILFKRRWIIIACFVIVTAVTATGVALLPPTYEAQAKVLVKTEQQVTPAFFSGLAAYSDRQEIDPVNRRLENEMALIGAAPIARAVLSELGLGWNQIYHPPLAQFTEALARFAGPRLQSMVGAPYRPPSDAETVAALQASVGVGPGVSRTAETTSNVIVVSVKSPTAETARSALEKILNRYLAFDRELSDDAGVKARALVATELDVAKQDLATAESTMRDFLSKSGFDPAGSEIERHPGRVATEGVVMSPRDNQTVAELKSTLVGLESELTAARQIYRPESENVGRIERRVALLEARLSEEIKLGADNFAQYNRLDRTLRAAETRSAELDRRRAEIDLFLQINKQSTGNRVVIEPPVLPEESDWKKRLATALLGSFMGLLLGVALAGVSEYADSTLGSKEDVHRYVGVDVLAALPKATARELKAAFSEGTGSTPAGTSRDSGLALTARAMASRIATGINGANDEQTRGRSLLVTSARNGEGKTFVATLLANELVRCGCGNVLLVEANGHDQTFNANIGTPFHKSLNNGKAIEANRTAGVDESRPTSVTRFTAGNGHGSAGETDGGALPAFLERERQRFDWIVFDSSSVVGHGLSALAQQVDAVLLVVEAEATRRHVVQHALDALDVVDVDRVKVVLNRKRRHIPAFLYERV